jgi:hypothetical protein
MLYGHDLHTNRLLLDTKKKNTYGLKVGISTVFEIVGTSCLRGWNHPYGHDLYIITFPDTGNKNIYSFGW